MAFAASSPRSSLLSLWAAKNPRRNTRTAFAAMNGKVVVPELVFEPEAYNANNPLDSGQADV